MGSRQTRVDTVMMMVGVEGPSDYIFWNKVLHKYLKRSGIRFDIRIMKTKEKLIKRTPDLLDDSKNLHYKACFIVLDRDKDPCCDAVLESFDQVIQEEARKDLSERFLHVCVAIRELEAWYLADSDAVQEVFGCSYNPPIETGAISAGKKLEQLCRKTDGRVKKDKRILAGLFAPKFHPGRAKGRSKSFDYFWSRLLQASK